MIVSIIQLIRPQEWLKNFFIFLPVFFGGYITDSNKMLLSIVVFIAYSLSASSIYCFNDICDAETDRTHPAKLNRPVASKAISKNTAYIIMSILLVSSFFVIYTLPETVKWKVMELMGFYYLMNIAYCLKLKQIAVLDVFIIATGFVFRVLAGGIVTEIDVSHWIVLMTFLLALFLSFAKRRDDVVIYLSTDVKTRKSVSRYSLEFVNQAISIVASVVIVCYILYTVSDEVIKNFQTSYLYVTSVFVLAGIIRYLQLTIIDIKSGNPTKVLTKDRFIQLCLAGWIISFFIIIYL
jgi:4-hydroxybenzoate polyprenyltransferase